MNDQMPILSLIAPSPVWSRDIAPKGAAPHLGGLPWYLLPIISNRIRKNGLVSQRISPYSKGSSGDLDLATTLDESKYFLGLGIYVISYNEPEDAGPAPMSPVTPYDARLSSGVTGLDWGIWVLKDIVRIQERWLVKVVLYWPAALWFLSGL